MTEETQTPPDETTTEQAVVADAADAAISDAPELPPVQSEPVPADPPVTLLDKEQWDRAFKLGLRKAHDYLAQTDTYTARFLLDIPVSYE